MNALLLFEMRNSECVIRNEKELYGWLLPGNKLNSAFRIPHSEFAIDTLCLDELQWIHTKGGSYVQEERADCDHSPPHALGG